MQTQAVSHSTGWIFDFCYNAGKKKKKQRRGPVSRVLQLKRMRLLIISILLNGFSLHQSSRIELVCNECANPAPDMRQHQILDTTHLSSRNIFEGIICFKENDH